MKVLVVGKSIFADRLCSSLEDYGVKAHWFKKMSIKSILKIIYYDRVYFIGGAIEMKSGPKKWALIIFSLLLNKTIIIHWIGSDVLRAVRNNSDSLFSSIIKRKANHICETECIEKELRNLNINPSVIPYQYIDVKPNLEINFRKDSFNASIYLGQGNEEFYGLELFRQLVIDFPEVNFTVFGSSNIGFESNNLAVLGWTNDVESVLLDSHVFLRLPEHDGLGHTALQALSLGRYVFRRFGDTSCTIYVNDYVTLKNEFLKIFDSFRNNDLQINLSGIEFVKNNYGKERIMNNLICHLRGLV